MIVFLFLVMGLSAARANLTKPLNQSHTIVLIGPISSGKSALANALLGCDPRNSSCGCDCDLLNVHSDNHVDESFTTNTTMITGKWRGNGTNIKIVDTPGFGNDDDDQRYMDALMNSLTNRVNYADTVLLVVSGSPDLPIALSESVQNLLRRISLTFGDGWWDHLVIGVSNWPYDEESINHRKDECEQFPDFCKDEDNFREKFGNEIKEELGLELNLTYVFADSWSQSGDRNKNDISQQKFWRRETDILWNITAARESTFSFKTINQVLEENEEMRGEIKWLHDIIAQNISQLSVLIEQNTQKIGNNSFDIEKNKENISINTIDIGQNKDLISNNSATIEQNLDKIVNNSATIEQNTEKITNNSANIEQNFAKITNNSAKIEQNMELNTYMYTKNKAVIFDHQRRFERIAPIGTIIAWYGEERSNTSIPPGWQLCDGSNITYGRMAGQRTPNLNGAGTGQGLFIRGGWGDEVGEIEDDAIQDHLHVDDGHSHRDLGHLHPGKSHVHNYRRTNGSSYPTLVGAKSNQTYEVGIYHNGYLAKHLHLNNGTQPIADKDIFYMDFVYDTSYHLAEVEPAKANISETSANIKGVSPDNGVRVANETRPKNMKAVFIMRIEKV